MNDAAKAAIARQDRQNQNQGIAKYFQRQATGNAGNAPQAPRRPNTAQIQGNLSEDEALARALQASLGDAGSSGTGNESSLTQEEQDRMLALSLAQGEQTTATTTGRTGTSSNSDKSCQIS